MKYFNFLLLLSSFTFLFACGDSAEIEDNPDTKLVENFMVYGTIKDASNKNILVQTFSPEGLIEVAKGTTDSDGNFEIIGNIPEFGIYQLSVENAEQSAIPITLVPKDKLEVNSSLKNLAFEPNLSGTEWSDEANAYLKAFKKFSDGQQNIMQKQNTVSQEELMKEALAMKSELDGLAKKQMIDDPSNPFNILLAMSLSPQMGFENWDQENLAAMKKVHEAYQKKFASAKMTETLGRQIQQIELGYNEYSNFQSQQSADANAPEISLKNPQGKTINLSSLRGKVVLIDFWASWCGPCRKENPNVVRLYNEYKDKGFTIYSVSLDDDAAAWQRAIKEDGLSWPNHVSDLMKWNSSMPQLYGFQGIPYTVLIDGEGKIIARGLRGTELEQKLKSIL